MSVLALSLMIAAAPTAPPDEPVASVGAYTEEESILVTVEEDYEQSSELDKTLGEVTPASVPSNGWTGPLVDFGVSVGVDGPDGLCVVTDLVDPVAGLVPCDDLVRPVEGEDGGEDGQESVGDEAGPVIITVTRSDFAELPLALPVVHLQPEREWFLVNMELLVFTDGDEQVLDTRVLGVPVRVRARPVEFSWDFGDGSEPVVTTGPGAPWPATDVGHVYTSEARGVVVTLTTTWSGEFQVAGQGPWIPIAGTTSTQSQSAPFRLEAVQTRLTAHH